MQEHIASLGVTALLVPEQNGIFTQHISIVQNSQNLAEQFQQLAVFIAVHLQARSSMLDPIMQSKASVTHGNLHARYMCMLALHAEVSNCHMHAVCDPLGQSAFHKSCHAWPQHAKFHLCKLGKQSGTHLYMVDE